MDIRGDHNIARLMPTTASCAACAATDLVPHLRVAGDAGPHGLIPSTDRFGTALADIVRCPACGHMQVAPMPDTAVLAEAYADAASDAYIAEEAGQRETARRALERIEHHLRRRREPPELLDLGCWVGFLLAEARERGWATTGVEPSAFGSAFARDRLGLNVLTAGLLDAELPAGRYDAAVLGDVIEHFPDPAGALERVRRLLVPEGIVWLALPDAGSRVARTMGRRWWSVLPTHVQYFTRGSLTTLLDRSGFATIEVATAPKAFTVRYYLERIGGYSPPLGRALVGAAGAAGVADRMWAPDFRDRMMVVARAR